LIVGNNPGLKPKNILGFQTMFAVVDPVLHSMISTSDKGMDAMGAVGGAVRATYGGEAALFMCNRH
jgi:hypothetical protein